VKLKEIKTQNKKRIKSKTKRNKNKKKNNISRKDEIENKFKVYKKESRRK
jgi:hypothetical protein